MELRDYLQMLRRGWLVVLGITAAVFLATLGYVSVAPKTYHATATLLITASNPKSISDLQTANSYANSAAPTYAQIIDSAVVLGPAGSKLSPQLGSDELSAMVTTSVRVDTTLIDIDVIGPQRDKVADIANAVAAAGITVIPELESNSGSSPFIAFKQARVAVEPEAAETPNVKRTLALGFAIGVLLGITVAIVSQSVDTRLRRIDEMRKLADLPLLASIPKVKRSQRGLVVRTAPTTAAAEAFRTLWTSLRLSDSPAGRRLLITPVSDGRDGVFVSANLAGVLAQSGRRVVLVDLDLRRSPLTQLFELPTTIGVAEVLEGTAQLEPALVSSPIERLSLLPSGHLRESPAELLGSAACANLIKSLEQRFDHVIMQAPPFLTYADAAVLSRVASGMLLTLSAGRTRDNDLTTALLSLHNLRITPVGLALTNVHGKPGPGGRMTSYRSSRDSAAWAEWHTEDGHGSLDGAQKVVAGRRSAGGTDDKSS